MLFTYRHPLEVALSLKKREDAFTLDHGLRLWIVYNMRGIENSQDLCRVTSSNEAILADPLQEINRISKELTDKCGVPKPERELTEEDVARFVDPNLQHNKKQREKEDNEKKVLEKHGDCLVHDFVTEQVPGTPNYDRERDLYLKAMKMYCDFQNGSIYKQGYKWPELA